MSFHGRAPPVKQDLRTGGKGETTFRGRCGNHGFALGRSASDKDRILTSQNVTVGGNYVLNNEIAMKL